MKYRIIFRNHSVLERESLDAIPNSDDIISLYCYSIDSVVLDCLPDNLEYLICTDCYYLKKIEYTSNIREVYAISCPNLCIDNIPNNIYKLNLSKNMFSDLNMLVKLEYITIINLNENNIECIPNLNGLDYLEELYINDNMVTHLSHLPESLKILYCENNNIDTIYNLPTDLERLYCSNNNLKDINIGNLSKLEIVDLSFNRVEYIPAFPVNIEKIKCNFNRIISFPDLSNLSKLKRLICSGNNLRSIPNLERLENLKILICNHNRIVSLNNLNALHKLEELHCGFNMIEILFLPDNLKRVYCNNNRIRLINHIPKTLTILNCHDNHLTYLNSLSETLDTLECSNNRLQYLPQLKNLTQLFCQHNLITSLPSLPYCLEVLYFYSNMVRIIPTLPTSLIRINFYNNMVTSFPMSIIYCTQLEEVHYHNNNIEHIPNNIHRFLNNIDTIPELKIYHDRENVHSHHIQACIKKSIENILTYPLKAGESAIHNILRDSMISNSTKKLTIDYCDDETVHSVLYITFSELLDYVWDIIVHHPDKDTLKHIFDIEMQDSQGLCFTGRLSRLVNTLSGFSDKVEINISINEQINNIIILTKQQLDTYDIVQHKFLVDKEMMERGYSREIINEWLNYIE